MAHRQPRHYARTLRLEAALSQADLGSLLGYSDSFIHKCEMEQRAFTARYVIGCSIIFGKPIHTLFPALIASIQDEIGRGASVLNERLRDQTDAAALKQLAVLSAITKHTISISEL